MGSEPLIGRRQLRLTAATLSGMGWSYSTTIAIACIQILYVAVMSRLLDPVAFGVYAIAMLAVNMGNSFARMGLAQALIQRPSISRDDIRAAATAGTFLGTAIFGLLWALAPWVARFFSEPDALPVMRLMGMHFIFLGLGVTSQGLLRRNLCFRELAIAHVAAYTLGYAVVGITMAVLGGGVWSLAGAVLTAHFLQALFQYLYVRHPLCPTFHVRRFASLYSFGTRASLLGFSEFLGRQLDTFAVGRYTTTALLGQYSRAFVIVNLPLSQHLAQSLRSVMFPGFSKIQQDKARLKRVYVSLLTLGGLLIFSVSAGMAVAAREIVLVVLGNQWDLAIGLVPFFALAVGLNVMTRFAELVCEARAELNKALGIQMTYLVLLGLGYVGVSRVGGAVPFAATLAVSEILRHVAFAMVIRNVIGVRLPEVFRAYAPAFVAAAGVACGVAVVRHMPLVNELPVAAVLSLQVLAGGATLGLCIRFNPFGRVRQEILGRLYAAGVIGEEKRKWRTLLVWLLVGSKSLREGRFARVGKRSTV